MAFRKNITRITGTMLSALVCQAAQAGEGMVDSASFEFGSHPQQRMARVAVQKDWDQRWLAYNGYHLSGYWETNAAVWRLNAYENVVGRKKNLAVLGFTPVFRYQNDNKLGAYGEIGVGVNLFSTLYKNEDKELATAFQFGDHIAVGYMTRKWDVSLKFQHYSNASIKRPNAGANWLVFKTAYRF